jgi:hypothetical protein
MTVDEKIHAIRAEQARDEAKSARLQEKGRRKQREEFRDSVRNGAFRNMHAVQCDICLRAVLTCDGGAVCNEGRKHERWW